MVGIYKITSPTGKVYIGQSWDIQKRWGNYRRLACKTQIKLYKSLQRHSTSTHRFEILTELPSDVTQDILDTYEIYYWEQYISCGYKMLNLKEPGSRGKQSDTIKAKIKATKAKNPYTHPQSTKQYLSKIHKGKKDSEETRYRKSQAHIGVVHEKAKCPHCNTIGGIRCMKRWHFDNCKNKKL